MSRGRTGTWARNRPRAKIATSDRRKTLARIRGPGRGIQPLRQGEGDRDPDDEQEEREDQVGGGPAVPLGVLERGIDGLPGARVVHQDHPGDREAAEDVQRHQSSARRDRGQSVDPIPVAGLVSFDIAVPPSVLSVAGRSTTLSRPATGRKRGAGRFLAWRLAVSESATPSAGLDGSQQTGRISRASRQERAAIILP